MVKSKTVKNFIRNKGNKFIFLTIDVDISTAMNNNENYTPKSCFIVKSIPIPFRFVFRNMHICFKLSSGIDFPVDQTQRKTTLLQSMWQRKL